MKLKKSFLSCKGGNKLGAVIGRFVTDAPIKPPSAEGGRGDGRGFGHFSREKSGTGGR